jgi:hypothetical protein
MMERLRGSLAEVGAIDLTTPATHLREDLERRRGLRSDTCSQTHTLPVGRRPGRQPAAR